MRLLVVEDDELVAYSFARMLAPLGEVVVARSAAEANRLLALPRPWDAWFVDERLPDGRGHEVVAQARPMHPFTPALIMTGSLEGEIGNAAFAARASCIQKPFTRWHAEQLLADEADFLRRLDQ